MGGKLFAPHSERVSNEELKKVFDELYAKFSKYFASMSLTKAIATKTDHGDMDIIVYSKKPLDMHATILKELGSDVLDYHRNGYVYSFLYNAKSIGKKVHVDFILADSEKNHQSKLDYFSLNDFSAIVGMLARKLNFKYTDNGFHKKFQDSKGNFHSMRVSNSLRDGMKILGLDPSKFEKIQNQDDIANFVLESPLLDKEFFSYDELVHRDKEAHDARPGIPALCDQIYKSAKPRQIPDDDYFFKKYFPQKYEEYQKLVDDTNKAINIQKKYNGNWLITKFGMKPGPEIGKVLKQITDKFKDNLENTPEEEVSNYVKSLISINENKINYKDFFSDLKGR